MTMPVWLFSSGPVGEKAKPEDPADRRQGDKLDETLVARGHTVFHEKVDRDNLNMAERAAVRMAKAPDSDQRDWSEIRAWASEIAAELDHVATNG
jgi:menaquinone-dependent protoporphyrinogen oxidase